MKELDYPYLNQIVDLLQKSHPDTPREDLEKQLLQAAAPVAYELPMAPPWEACSNIDCFPSIGWRMGSGEEYLNAFSSWLNSLPAQQIKDYQKQHPEPKGFSGMYEAILSERKISALNRERP